LLAEGLQLSTTDEDLILAKTVPISELKELATVGRVASARLPRKIPLSGAMRMGRDTTAKVPLLHPQVSRQHAEIILRAPGRAELRDLGSANGTFVNGRRLAGRPVLLDAGDCVNIGPYALEFTGTELVSQDRINNVELVARDIRRVVTNRQTGKAMTLL